MAVPAPFADEPQQRWDAEERLSFEDSERFEEDSLCSWLSEAESACNNWRGWNAQGPAAANNYNSSAPLPSLSYTGGITQSNAAQLAGSNVLSLVELCAKEVAREIPFEVVERFYPPVPEQLQLRIAFWSFPENEEDIRLYSCLANGNAEEYQKGDQLLRANAVKDLLQIGFHLSATVQPQQAHNQAEAGHSRNQGLSYNVAVTLDRRRITSCTCTCSPNASWCSHVVAVCLHRINKPDSACLRAPVSESLSRLQRDQLQKFAQYLISELPRQILPTAQKLLDELLLQSTAINTLTGAPDPTAGASILDVSSWCLEDSSLHRNIRKILEKFCVPSPTVLSDVNYLSSTAPPAATEWQSVLQPLVGRLPEGLWNLLSIVREMNRRHDHNATQLLNIITNECIATDQVLMWWYNTKLSQALIGNQLFGAFPKNNFGNAATAQYSCAFLCDEIVDLWRLAALDPSLSPEERQQLCCQLKEFHLKVIDKINRLLNAAAGTGANPNGVELIGHHNQNGNQNHQVAVAVGVSLASSNGLRGLAPNDQRRYDFDAFPGFKKAIEACMISWSDYQWDGITYRRDRLCKFSNCFVRPAGVRSDNNSACSTLGASNPSPSSISPLSQGCISPSLPVLRDKQFRNFSSLKQLLGHKDRGPSTEHRRDTDSREMPSSSASMAIDVKPAQLDLGKSSSLDDSALNSSDESVHEGGEFEAGRGERHREDSGVCRRRSSTPQSPLIEEPIMLPAGLESPEKSGALHIQVVDDLEQLYIYDQQEAVKPTVRQKPLSTAKTPTEFVSELFETLACSCDHFEIKFSIAEALHVHGYREEACKLAVELAEELLTNPPDLMVAIPPLSPAPPSLTPTKQARRNRRSVDAPVYIHPLAYKISHLASSTLSRAAFLTSVIGVHTKHHHLAFRLAMFGLELSRPPAATKFLEVKTNQQEIEIISMLRKLPLQSEEMNILRDRAQKLRSGTYCQRPLPVLPLSLASFLFESLCWNEDNFNPCRLPTDEQLGFEAAVAALGLKPCVSEAEHPLLCEGMRRQRGELALTLLLRYKDNAKKIAVSMDKLLDREMHRMYKNHASNAAFYGFDDSELFRGAMPPPLKIPTRDSSTDRTSELQRSFSGVSVGSLQLEDVDDHEVSMALEESFSHMEEHHYGDLRDTSPWDEIKDLENLVKAEPTEGSPGLSGCDAASTDSSSSGISRGGGAKAIILEPVALPPVNAVAASSCSVTTSKVCANGSAVSDSQSKSYFKLSRNRRRVMPSLPNQPSEAHAHFMFELAKTLLTKAGGTHSTAIFSAGPHNAAHQPNGVGPHRALHLCAFQIGLYALGLHNRVSTNWLSRTYSSHVSWISGQAMEIGRVALRLLIDTWENHLTPTEVANLADKASQGRDPAMVAAAAELALSALPHAHALNPTEIQRALVQCKEQNQVILEKACLAVENAAKDGGVYPEVLFLVARQWYTLYTEAAGIDPTKDINNHHLNNQMHSGYYDGQSAGGASNQMQPMMPPMPTNCAPMGMPNMAALLPFPYNLNGVGPMSASTGRMNGGCAGAQQQQQQQQMPAYHHMAGPNGVGPGCNNGSPAVFAYHPVSAPPPTTANGMFPQLYANPIPHYSHGAPVQMTYSIQATFMGGASAAAYPNQMANVHGGYQMPPQHQNGGNPGFVPVFIRPLQMPSVSPRLHPSHSAPNLAPQQQPMCEENGQHQEQLRYLYAAYRVGMLAMETMGRRIHDDNRNYVKYAPNPPYGDDVKWLFKISKKLGMGYVQQYCIYAALSIVSPFVLYDIAQEAANLSSRGNNPLSKALHPPHIQPHIQELVRKYIEMFELAALQKLSHPRFTPSDAEELITLVRTARNAYNQVGAGHQFEVLLHSKIKKTKACKKDLWNRLLNALSSS